MAKRKRKIKPGNVVIWDHTNFGSKFWDSLSEEDRIKYYGRFGYGKDKYDLFVFIAEINDSGHCVLVSLSDQHVETMAHICEFRRAEDDEF